MSNSIHTARWINQVAGQGWDMHLFPSIAGTPVHASMDRNVTVHRLICGGRVRREPSRYPGIGRLGRGIGFVQRRIVADLFPDWPARRLARVVRAIRPDVVHSLEIQAAGYLTLAAKERLAGPFPPWIVTNWGSDIQIFGRLREHEKRIRGVLENCDYYSCECVRDVDLARTYGFDKTVLPVFPNAGGFDLSSLHGIRSGIETAQRRTIMLKGYQNWAGRALVGLRALERCRDVLGGYTIVIYSADPDVVMAAELFTSNTGIATKVLSAGTAHAEILSFHAQARISIALSIGDAISTSLLEAMVMGSFPIQSSTACAEEWIEHGLTGMIVPPEDPEIVETAIRTALSEDDLVNQAAAMNWQVAQRRLDDDVLRQKAIDMYRSIVA